MAKSLLQQTQRKQVSEFIKQEHGTYATQTFDLAGGGEVSEDGKTLIKAGDASLYNMEWPADSTVAIIQHWKDELKFDMSRFKYWSMDNEMEATTKESLSYQNANQSSRSGISTGVQTARFGDL